MGLRFPSFLKNLVLLMSASLVTASMAAAAAPAPLDGSSAAAKTTKKSNTVSDAVTDQPATDEPPVGYSRGELITSTDGSSSWRRSKDTKFAYKFASGFDSFANEKEQSQFFGIGVKADAKAQLMSSLSARIKAGVVMNTGYAQSQFGDNVGKSGVFLQEAVMNWRAIDSSFARFYVGAGALDQGAFDASLFVDRYNAFPGVKETLAIGSMKEFKFKIWAQQTIPVSKNLSTKTVDAEVTPSFYSETAEIEIDPNEYLHGEGSVTHFAFNNLPSATALESVMYGNSINEIGPNTSAFKYRFDGVMARGGFRLNLTKRFAWESVGYVVQNTAAPEGYRNLQYLITGFNIGLPAEIDFRPRVGTFFAEDDAVPGFYNSSTLGHNNRKGLIATADLFFQRQRFKVWAQYVDAEVINPNVNQTRQQTMTINFETFYEML